MWSKERLKTNVRRVKNKYSNEFYSDNTGFHVQQEDADKGFSRQEEREKAHSMCDPVDQSNFPAVKWANAVNGSSSWSLSASRSLQG